MPRQKRTEEEKYAELLAKLPEFCLMDDTFMTAFFDGQNDLMEFVLKIILQKDDLKVLSTKTQIEIHSVKGRSARLDVYAVDSKGKHYDFEVQNADDGADVKRARFNSSMMDSTFLKKKEKFKELPESYVIFITENDVLGGNKPIYHIDRFIKELDYKTFGDGQHIIYVNGSFKGDDELGKLIFDFKCKNAKDMNYKILSERADYIKTEGGSGMCKIMDDLIQKERAEERAEVLAETKKEFVIGLLNSTTLSKSEIALASKMTLKEVEQIAKELEERV